MDEESARKKVEKEATDLDQAWRNLQKEEIDDSYKDVYGRLPLTTAKEFLDKFQKESKAIVFATKQEDFLKQLGEVLYQHVNEVILKKNVHPVMQDIYKDANIIKKRISSLISRQKEAIKHQDPSQHKPFAKLDVLSFQISLDNHEDDEFFNNFQKDFDELDVLATPTMVVAHDNLMDLFRQETTMQHLLSKLKAALQEHYRTLLERSERGNGLFVSESSFILFAEMSCETLVNKFIVEHARDFIDTCVTKLANKRPSRKTQKQWKDFQKEETEREILFKEHFDELQQYLSSLLRKGTRKQGLVSLCEKLRKAIDDRMLMGLKEVDDNPNIKKDNLELIKKQNKLVSTFSLNIIQDVNPHPDHDKGLLDSKTDFPDPLKTIDGHEATTLPSVNHNRNLDKVFKLLVKRKEGALDELRRKLKLTVGSLKAPKGKDKFEWTKTLLTVLYDSTFHHKTFGEQSLPDSLKVPLSSIPEQDITRAKEQLFAFQKSMASCKMVQEPYVPSDTINIQINESKDGFTASVNADLMNELKKLNSLDDPMKQLAPIFIPSIHYGPNKDALGNLYLEDDPWAAKEKDEEDDETAVPEQSTGLEDLNAAIFCVVEPGDVDKFRSSLKEKPPSNITFRYVVLPQDGRGIGVSRSIIKILAECLELQFYWTIDDDVKIMKEFNKNSRHWMKCTIGRGLLYGQRVFQDCIDKAVIDLDYNQRYGHHEELRSIFPEWADKARLMVGRLMLDDTTHKKMKQNITCLNAEFPDEIMQEDCGGDQDKVNKWLESKGKCIEKCKEHLLKGTFKRIGRVSIGHESGTRSGYHTRGDMHYRKSPQNYQMVFHNTAASKGFNFVTDDVLLRQEGGTVHQQKQRDIRHLGMKLEDKSFCKALEFYGIVGYQVITVVQRNENLRNAFGRIGNAYLREEYEDESDEAITGQ